MKLLLSRTVVNLVGSEWLKIFICVRGADT
jgi:hypothetical protein